MIFWAWHARVHPYAYAFQNAIEHWLFLTSCIFVLLATAYTWHDEPSSTIESALISVLIGSLLGIGAIPLYFRWRGPLRRARESWNTTSRLSASSRFWPSRRGSSSSNRHSRAASKRSRDAISARRAEIAKHGFGDAVSFARSRRFTQSRCPSSAHPSAADASTADEGDDDSSRCAVQPRVLA